MQLQVQAGRAQIEAASTPTTATCTNATEPTWRQKPKQQMGDDVQQSLAATLPHAALHEERSSSHQYWAPTPSRNRGPPPCDESVEEASASRAARLEGKVTKASTESEQLKNEWWEAPDSQSYPWQHAHEFQDAKQQDETWNSTPASGGAKGDWQSYNQAESVVTGGSSHGGLSDGGQGAPMPVVDKGASHTELDPVPDWSPSSA